MPTFGRLSNYGVHALLNHIHGIEQMERPTVWAGALTGLPSDDGVTLNEVSASGYGRVETAWSGASNRTASNAEAIEFDPARADWGTVSHIGLFDAEVRGNLLGSFPVLDAKAVESGDILKIEKNEAIIQVSTPPHADGSGGFSDYLANAVLQHLLGVQTFPMPTSLYLMALLGQPTNGGVYEEVTGGGYTRVLTNNLWGSAAGRLIENRADITFPAATGDWGTISHVGLIQTSTPNLGILYWWAPLSTVDTIVNGETLVFPANDIRISI